MREILKYRGAFQILRAALGACVLAGFTGTARSQCNCGDDVQVTVNGNLKGSCTITVGGVTFTIPGGGSTAVPVIDRKFWVRVPKHEEVAVVFDFAEQNQPSSGDGLNCSFGCGGYEVRQGGGNPWGPGSAFASGDDATWSVRAADPDAGNNLPGSDSDPEPGGSMPSVRSHTVTDYSNHPAPEAGFSMNLGGAAGDLSFGGQLHTGSTFHNKSSVRLYPSTTPAQRIDYSVAGQIQEVLAKNSSGTAVAHYKIVDVVDMGTVVGYDVQVSLPSQTTGTGPWTPGARLVTYRVTNLTNTNGYFYGAMVEKLVGNPTSPSQTTTKKYYGSRTGTTSHHEVHHLIPYGNTIIERYSSEKVSATRKEIETRIEVVSGIERTLSRVETIYQLNFGEEMVQNRKVYHNDMQFLETAYTFTIDGRVQSVQESQNGVAGAWKMFSYVPPSSGVRTVHEFSPWGSSPTMPGTVPTPGYFNGRQKTTEYTLINKGWRVKSVTEYGPSGSKLSEVSYAYNTQSNPSQMVETLRTTSSTTLTTTWEYSTTADWTYQLPTTVTRPDGSRTTYSYVVTSGQEVVTETEEGPSGPVNGKSIQRVTKTTAATGNLAREETWAYIGGAWTSSPVTYTDYSYDTHGRLTNVWRDGMTSVETRVYQSGGGYALDRVEETTDVFGMTDVEHYDEFGRLTKTTRKGAAAAYGHPAVPDSVTTYARVANPSGGFTLTVTKGPDADNNGLPDSGPSLATIEVLDQAGRTVSTTDLQGMVTSYAYSNSGGMSVTTVTKAGGSASGTHIETTETHGDGTLYRVHGTAVERRVFAYASSDGLQTTEYIGVMTIPVPATGHRWRKTTLDLGGRVVTEEQPGQSGTVIRKYLTGRRGRASRASWTSLGASYSSPCSSPTTGLETASRPW